MATPIINNLKLPDGRILVLPDEGDQTSTGAISQRSPSGGGHFRVGSGTGLGPEQEYAHILFCREMATEVEVDDVGYLAMHQNAVVGLIPD